MSGFQDSSSQARMPSRSIQRNLYDTRFTVLLSLLRLASILSRSPVFEQRISVAWTVVRRPSLTVFRRTRSSIEPTLASPIGQPNAYPGTSKPFFVAQPAANASSRTAASGNLWVILTSLDAAREDARGVHEKLMAQQTQVYHRVAPGNGDLYAARSVQRVNRNDVRAPRQARPRDGDLGRQRAPGPVVRRIEQRGPGPDDRRGERERGGLAVAGGALRLDLERGAGGRADRRAQHDAGHVVLQAPARHQVDAGDRCREDRLAAGDDARRRQREVRGLDDRERERHQDRARADPRRHEEFLRAQARRRPGAQDEQNIGHAVVGRGDALIEPAQRFLEHRLPRLQFVREAVAGRGEARLAERLVDEAREVVRERALVAVPERVHRRVVDGLDRVAVQLLHARARAAAFRLLLELGELSRARLGDLGLALVRLLDRDARVVVIAHGAVIERHVREQHHLLVVVGLVRAQLVADHEARRRGCEPRDVREARARLDALVRGGPRLLALAVATAEPLQHAELQVIEEILVGRPVVRLEQPDRGLDVAARCLLEREIELGVVVTDRGAAGHEQRHAPRG